MIRSLSNQVGAIGVAGFVATALILFAQDAAYLAALFNPPTTQIAAPSRWSSPVDGSVVRLHRKI
jgi:hypothetical protein